MQSNTPAYVHVCVYIYICMYVGCSDRIGTRPPRIGTRGSCLNPNNGKNDYFCSVLDHVDPFRANPGRPPQQSQYKSLKPPNARCPGRIGERDIYIYIFIYLSISLSLSHFLPHHHLGAPDSWEPMSPWIVKRKRSSKKCDEHPIFIDSLLLHFFSLFLLSLCFLIYYAA